MKSLNKTETIIFLPVMYSLFRKAFFYFYYLYHVSCMTEKKKKLLLETSRPAKNVFFQIRTAVYKHQTISKLRRLTVTFDR